MKKRYKIPIFLFSFLFLAGFIFWLLLNQTRLLENQVNRLVNVWLENKYSIRINTGDVYGPFWRELTVTDLTVDYVKEGLEYRMAEFPSLRVNFKISNLWRKKWIFDSLTVDRPKVSLRKNEEGGILGKIPERDEEKVISKTGLFDLRIGKLKISDGDFEYVSPDKKLTLDNLGCELSLSKDRDGFKVAILGCDVVFPEKDFRLKNLKGSLLKRGDSLMVDTLDIQTERSMVQMQGSVSNLKAGEFSFSVKAEPIDCQDIRSLTGVRLEGILDVDGTVEGNLKKFGGEAKIDGLFFDRKFEISKVAYSYQKEKLLFSHIQGIAFGSPLNGRGYFDFSMRPEEYEFEGELSHLNIDNIVFGSIQTDFSGHLLMRGSSTSEKELFMQADVDLKDGRIEQYTFSQAQGIMDITTSAVTFHPQFQLRYKNTDIVLGGQLEYDGEVNIDARVNFNDLTDFRDQIFIEEIRGRGEAFVKFSGKTEDFDIQGEFASDSCYAYELYSADAWIEAKVKNFLTIQKGEASVRFLDGNAWSVNYDSLVSNIKMENQGYKIDSAWMGSEHFYVNLWGELDATKIPQTLLVYQLILNYEGNQLESSSPMVVTIDSQKVEVTKCLLYGSTGQVEASGDIDYQERMNLTLNISGFDIAPWAGLLIPEPVEGMLDCQIAIQGDFLNPQIETKAQIQQFKFRQMRLGQLTTDLFYTDKKLQVKDLSVTERGWDYSLSGTLPLDLSFVEVEKRLLDEPQSFRLSAKGKELELIRLFIPDIEHLTGDFQGELDISGTLLHPQFEGTMTLRNGELKFMPLSDPVRDLKADVRMKNEYLILEEASGVMKSENGDGAGFFTRLWRIFSKKEKAEGTVNGFGTINLKNVQNVEYDLYLSGKNIPIDYEYADLTATADATAQIKGESPPTVTAEIALSELFYREPFTSNGSGALTYSPQVAEELWNWNIDVSVANNCWIINDDVNLEFRGDVLVLRDAGKLTILGSMETIRGTYFLYGTKFKIEEGSFFFENLEEINPSIDFLVSTRLWGGASGASEGSNLLGSSSSDEIILAIGGTLAEPEVSPASGSPYTSEDIIELLAFQRGLGTMDSLGVGTLFQERVVKSLGGGYSSRLLENIAGRSLGVETFEIVPTWSEKFRLADAQITIGKYLSDKVYLHYTRRLSQSSGQETGVEYRLNKHLFLEGRKDKLGLFHLGFNLNWEF